MIAIYAGTLVAYIVFVREKGRQDHEVGTTRKARKKRKERPSRATTTVITGLVVVLIPDKVRGRKRKKVAGCILCYQDTETIS